MSRKLHRSRTFTISRYSMVEYLFVLICHVSFFCTIDVKGYDSYPVKKEWKTKWLMKIIDCCYEHLVAFKFSFYFKFLIGSFENDPSLFFALFIQILQTVARINTIVTTFFLNRYASLCRFLWQSTDLDVEGIRVLLLMRQCHWSKTWEKKACSDFVFLSDTLSKQ